MPVLQKWACVCNAHEVRRKGEMMMEATKSMMAYTPDSISQEASTTGMMLL